ncbi:exosome component 10 [Copidosoma floridanum]|uniref:exosome component 10 n=1 Tax=Copidosoma floridanum TaxID=29053 RepID=UPI000C6F8110|nr:exosome component 10 [Copidosoma floridanum]
MFESEVAKKYCILVGTLYRLKNCNTAIKNKKGPVTTKSKEEEQEFVNWILHRAATGCPATVNELKDSVQQNMLKIKKENKFLNDRPGRHWFKGFKRRHPNILYRTAQSLELLRADVTEEDQRNWFREIITYLESKSLVTLDACRVFNCDETSLQLNPKPSKVLAEKGAKTIYQCTDGNEKDNHLVLFTYSADGLYNYFYTWLQNLFSKVRDGIKTSNSLPNDKNFNYYLCFPVFNKMRTNQIIKITSVMQNIIEKVGVLANIKQRDVEEKFDLLLESNDIFLDRAGARMDEESGINKNPSSELIVSQSRMPSHLNGSWNSASYINKQIPAFSNSSQAIRLLSGKNIQKPQLSFKDKIDNSRKPWQPKIKYKPNAVKLLELYTDLDKNGDEIFNHPYELELNNFEPSDTQLLKKPVIKYKSVDETPLIIIEKIEDLKNMLTDLEKCAEIAVDLEHHSYRSFLGITCVMQISTTDTDYLIDTLSLRSDLHILNKIFTDSSILKVFHGADSDVLWLQRDLSIYVVNMFDTHQAAKQLELPFLSLSYLLKLFCQIDINKHFQLADWRIRPLPNELLRYAREDTHYLLYLKNVLSNALIDAAHGQSNILKSVYMRSTDICKNTYRKPIWTEESNLNIYRKSQKIFNNRQLYAFKELDRWRDETARIEDDSTNYVLPNHMLLNIAETLPREIQGVLACCNPIPPLVRKNLLKIHKIILKAREQPLSKTILQEDIKLRLSQRHQSSSSESWNFSPHDVPSGIEVRVNLSCLLKTSVAELRQLKQLKLHPKISIFDLLLKEKLEMRNANYVKKKRKLVFVSPFKRYKLVQSVMLREVPDESNDGQECTGKLNYPREF